MSRAAALAAALAAVWLTSLAVGHAQAPPLAAAVTDDVIAVTSDYRGARVTVFGALPDRRGRGDVVVAVRGPAETATIMRKQRLLGLWVSGSPVRFADVPSFYMLASDRPLGEIASASTRARLGLDFSAGAHAASPMPARYRPEAYRAALVRLKRAEGLYVESASVLKRLPGGLFKATIQLPANAPVGAYAAEVYFFRNGRLIDSEKAAVLVSTAGLERFIKTASDERPLLYGLSAIAMALGAGWLASLLFRRP